MNYSQHGPQNYPPQHQQYPQHGAQHPQYQQPHPGPAHANPQPQKKRRRWPWIVGAVVLVVIIGSAMNGGNRTPAPVAAPQIPTLDAVAPVEVPTASSDDTAHMEVTGSGKALVTYMKKGGQEQKEVSLPWSADVEVDFITSLVAQKKGGGSGEIGCKITKGSEVIADNTSSGAYAVVSCTG
jgi:MmpS family membrane protein